MENLKHDIRESTPVEELIGNPPSSIVRWGISAIALVFVFTIIASWIISYPNIVVGKITMTTTNPPASMMAQISGQIKNLFVVDGQLVREGEHLALIETNADIESVLWLSKIIDIRLNANTIQVDENPSIYIPDDPVLGELSANYSSYKASLDNYINHISIDYYGKKINAVLAEIEGIDEYIAQLDKQEALYIEKLELVNSEYKRIESLHSDSVLTVQELEDSQKKVFEEKIQLEQIGLDMKSKIIDRASKLQTLEDYKASKEEERRKLFVQVENERLKLKGELDIWYMKHLLKSPIDGRVAFSNFWGKNQVVDEGDIVMTIVPEGEKRIIGKLELKMRRSGEVKINQQVLIKLEGYPFLEHGVLEGRVESVSSVATEDIYIVDVSLPNGMITNHGKELEFIQNMSGTAEIVTENISLIERIIDPLRSIVMKNRLLKED